MFSKLKKKLKKKKEPFNMEQNNVEDIGAEALSKKQLFLKNGYLEKCGGSVKTWKRRFFVLYGRTVFYYKDEYAEKPIDFVKVEGRDKIQRADEETGKQYSFKIVSEKRVLYCSADSEYTAQSWMHMLKSAFNIPSEHITRGSIRGFLDKQSKKDEDDWRPRFCSIHDGVFYAFKTPSDYDPLVEIDLRGVSCRMFNFPIKDAANDPLNRQFRNSFDIVVPDTTTSTIKQAFRFSSRDGDCAIWKSIIDYEAQSYGDLKDESPFKGWIFQDSQNKHKTWSLVYVVLRDSSLYFYENDKAKEPLSIIELTGRLVTRTDDEIQVENTFKIASIDTQMYLKCYEDDEADCWVETLKEVCKFHKVQEYAKKGYLTKQGGRIKTWKRRFCILRGSNLYYYGDEEDAEPKGWIELVGQCIRHLTPTEAIDEVNRDNVIKVFTVARTWYLCADTQQDAIEWSIVLRKAALMFHGKTLIVDETATTKDAKDNKYSTIQAAIQKANDMDRILIQAGRYKNGIVLKKPLILEGAGDVRIICGSSTPLVIRTTACKISNITIAQVSTNNDYNGVTIEKGNVLMSHCDISSRGANCISVNEESQLTLNNCKVHSSNHYGVWLSETASGLFENNIITENGWDGIMLMGESDAIFRGNKITKNSYNGISISTSGRAIVENCEISENNWDGVNVVNERVLCRIYDNTIQANKGYGIYFKFESVQKKGVTVDNTVNENEKGQIVSVAAADGKKKKK